MRSKAALHFLLVALLCFGQLVANVHVVGHFGVQHLDHHHGADHRVDDSHCFVLSLTDSSAHCHKHVDESADFHAKNDGEVSNDCAIYHVFLGQGGCMSAGSPHIKLPIQNAVATVLYLATALPVVVDGKHIRGPPLVS